MSTTLPIGPIELDIGGMSCASCASRIERRLNKLDGVTASVNYATERAYVQLPDGLSVADAIATVEASGYTARAHRDPATEPDQSDGTDDPELRVLRNRIIVSGTLAVIVMALSMVPPLQFGGWQWVSLVLAIPVVTWGAWPFHRSAALNLRHGATTMDTLVSLGIIAAFGWSVYALVWGGAGEIGMKMHFEWFPIRGQGAHTIYLEVATTLTALILLGRYFEARAKRRSGAALRRLLELGAKDVSVLRDGVELRLPIEELRVGDEFVVRPGEKIATDGIVIAGASAIDRSAFTGESVPVEVSVGDKVSGATLNSGGRLVVRATAVGSDTELAQIGHLIEQAQSGKAPIQRLADRVAAVFVPIVILIAVGTFIGWFIGTRSVIDALTCAVAVLVIACPCALGLATPTALLVGTGRGAELGILIKGPEILESTRTIDTIVVDKTGTVTSGRMQLIAARPLGAARGAEGAEAAEPESVAAATAESVKADWTELLRFAGAVEDASEHPVGRAIAAGATARLNEDLSTADEFENHAGRGVSGVVAGTRVWAGRPSWIAEQVGAPLDRALAEFAAAQEAQTHTTVAVGWDGAVRGILSVGDTIKPTSAQAVTEFEKLGLHTILLTGDHEQVARAVAQAVGIDEVIAGVLPADKAAVISGLQERGRVVAMVGDGVNDAAALASADLGIAMGSGTDVAIEASDLTLTRSDLLAAVDAIRLSRATLGRIKGNLFWAFCYNIAAIPLAVAGLLSPLIAGAAMAFSSVFVVQNSLLLRRFAPVAAEESIS